MATVLQMIWPLMTKAMVCWNQFDQIGIYALMTTGGTPPYQLWDNSFGNLLLCSGPLKLGKA